MNTYIANARIGPEHLEVISITHGIARVENLKGEQREVLYTDLVDVWPLSATLDAVDSMITEGWGVGEIMGLIQALTGSEEWATLLGVKWVELY